MNLNWIRRALSGELPTGEIIEVEATAATDDLQLVRPGEPGQKLVVIQMLDGNGELVPFTEPEEAAP